MPTAVIDTFVVNNAGYAVGGLNETLTSARRALAAEALNKVAEQIQRGLLEALGMSQMVD